jgi:hypothetical protein
MIHDTKYDLTFTHHTMNEPINKIELGEKEEME